MLHERAWGGGEGKAWRSAGARGDAGRWRTRGSWDARAARQTRLRHMPLRQMPSGGGRRAWHDDGGEADEEELLPHLHQLPEVPARLVRVVEEGECLRQLRLPLPEQRLPHRQEEQRVHERLQHGVEQDREHGEALDAIVLVRIAINRVVRAQVAPAAVVRFAPSR